MKETEEPKVWMPGVSFGLYERQSAELTKLKSDVARLREALKPFATVVEVINKNVMCDGGPIPDESFLLAHWEWNTSSDLTIGDCRNAARALEETK